MLFIKIVLYSKIVFVPQILTHPRSILILRCIAQLFSPGLYRVY